LTLSLGGRAGAVFPPREDTGEKRKTSGKEPRNEPRKREIDTKGEKKKRYTNLRNVKSRGNSQSHNDRRGVEGLQLRNEKRPALKDS